MVTWFRFIASSVLETLACAGINRWNHIECYPAKVFHDVLNHGLRVLGNDDIVLKEEQYEVVDLFIVLPTGFGKSLIYQLLSIFHHLISFYLSNN